MSVIILTVDEVMRTLSNDGQYPFVVKDKIVDIVRFALNTGFTDVVLDENTALRVMYQRPGETEVRAQTLTYYDTDGLHNYYDWQLSQSDLAKDGSLMVALCILDISGGEVSEWHTTPCAVRVLSTIHTDDSDEADETITPTVKERVAVLESMIQRVASGAPIVVASTSAMTDTSQIYVLSANGRWYYHNGSSWVAGGEYGAVATDVTLSQSGIPADAKAVGNSIQKNTDGLEYNSSVIDTTDYVTKYGVVTGRLSNDGQTTPSSTWVTTEYIPVTLGDYKITSGGSGYTLFAAKYDAEKNLVSYNSMTVQDMSFIYSVESDVSFVRLCISKDLFSTYGFHFRVAANSIDLTKHALKDLKSTKAQAVINAVNGNVINIMDADGGTPIDALSINFAVEQTGSGASSLENVRPFVGWTGCEITKTGKNLLAVSAFGTEIRNGVTFTRNADGTISVSGTATAYTEFERKASAYLPKGDYVLSGITEPFYRISLYAPDNSVVGTLAAFLADPYVETLNFTVDTPGIYSVNFAVARNTNFGNGIKLEPMIRNATDANSTFEQYESADYSISWEDENGIIYAGELNVEEKTLTVTHLSHKINDANSAAKSGMSMPAGRSGYYLRVDPKVQRNTWLADMQFVGSPDNPNNVICYSDMFDIGNKTAQDIGGLSDFAFALTTYGQYSTFWFNVSSEECPDENAFLNYINTLAPTVVYPLKTPIVQTEIDVSEISLSKGANNLWVDAGIISTIYRANTKLFVDKQINNVRAELKDTRNEYRDYAFFTGPVPIVAVMSYNVGEWYNGTRNEMPREEYSLYENIQKEIILKNFASIFCTQEYYYKAHEGAKSSKEVYLDPYYRHSFVSEAGVLTHGKTTSTNLPLISTELVPFVNAQGAGTEYQKSYVYINGHKVCVCNVHLSQLSDEYDLLQAQEVVDAVENEDYFIVVGDFNTWFDRTEGGETGPEIINRFRAIGGVPCNCGDFGIFLTYRGFGVSAPIDNIFVSSNITIKSVYIDETKVNAGIPIIDHVPLIAYLEIN